MTSLKKVPAPVPTSLRMLYTVEQRMVDKHVLTCPVRIDKQQLCPCDPSPHRARLQSSISRQCERGGMDPLPLAKPFPRLLPARPGRAARLASSAHDPVFQAGDAGLIVVLSRNSCTCNRRRPPTISEVPTRLPKRPGREGRVVTAAEGRGVHLRTGSPCGRRTCYCCRSRQKKAGEAGGAD